MKGRKTLLRSAWGQGYVEVVLVLPLILLFVAGVLFFGRVLYVKVALQEASMSGARAAVETLDPIRGVHQGVIAARETLRTFRLERAQISVSPLASWSYGTPLRVRTSFRVYVGDIPLVGLFYPDHYLSLTEEAYLRVEEFKSRWVR